MISSPDASRKPVSLSGERGVRSSVTTMDRPFHARPGPKSGLTETRPHAAGVAHGLDVGCLHRGTIDEHGLRGHGTSDIGGGPAGHPVRYGQDRQVDRPQHETHVLGEIEDIRRHDPVAISLTSTPTISQPAAARWSMNMRPMPPPAPTTIARLK